MLSLKKQQGMGSLGWLLLLSTIGFFLLLIFKLAPYYLTNQTIRGTMKQLATNNVDLNEMEPGEIRGALDRYMTINGVREISVKDFKIVRSKGRTLVNHEYEKRIHIIANAEVILTFRNQVDSTNVEECCKFLVEDENKKKDKNKP